MINLKSLKYLLFVEARVLHSVVVLGQVEFPAFSAPQTLVVSLLRDMEVPVSPPVPLVGVIRVNSVSPRPHRRLGEHKLLMRGPVEK